VLVASSLAGEREITRLRRAFVLLMMRDAVAASLQLACSAAAAEPAMHAAT